MSSVACLVLGVLRGSEIKPGSIVTNVENVSDSSRALDAATSKLSNTKQTVKDLNDETRGASTDKERELQATIIALNARITELENKQIDALKWNLKANEDLTRNLKQLAAGGIAGAFARTMVAPIDRIKILMQTQFISNPNAPPKYTSMWQTLTTVVREEGPTKLYRGNLTNLIRVVPYAGMQFASYDFFKKSMLAEGSNTLSVPQRLLAGALAAVAATTVTHPLDVCRLRLAVQPELKGTMDSLRSVWAENGIRSMFKGYVPTCISLAPFIAINFASFDWLKTVVYPDPKTKKNSAVVLVLGGSAGIFAQTICYPLDTVRRRMQMKGKIYNSTPDAFITIMKKEGPLGFYKGMLPNAVKVIPNNALRFVAFEYLRGLLGIEGAGDAGKGGD
jgi:solute carrier family 25 phosphate transporter 23/24/25/41